MTLHFGKHKGKTVEEVLEVDPTYIAWAVDNNIIQVDGKTLAIAKRARFEQYRDRLLQAYAGGFDDSWGDR